MEQVTVLLARAIAWVEAIDLNPRGKVFYPALAQALVQRYGFQVFPQKIEEFDEGKGIKFGVGRDGDTVIEQVMIYTHAILLDTRVSTDESQRVLERALEWAAKELGLAYKGPSSIRSWQYSSQLTFRSSALSLTSLSPAVRTLSEGISKAVEDISGEKLPFEPITLTFGHDAMKRKHPYGNFSIQRRENIPFEENHYFSDAFLPTDTHIRLLEQFEKSE